MTSERFARFKEILLVATDLDPDARAAYLDMACGEDASLREDVESALAHHDDDPEILRTSGLDDLLGGEMSAAYFQETDASSEGRRSLPTDLERSAIHVECRLFDELNQLCSGQVREVGRRLPLSIPLQDDPDIVTLLVESVVLPNLAPNGIHGDHRSL